VPLNVYNKPANHHHSQSIVAIHGLDPTGTQDHGMKTWTSRDNKMWLRDFLPQQLPKARIMVFGWNANVVFDPSINGIRDHARLLLTRLYNLRIVSFLKEQQ
jgi:hypothetical protein